LPAGVASPTPGLPASGLLRAVCFDLDDTLVDAVGAWRAGFAEAIAPLHRATPALQRIGTPAAIYDREFRPRSEQAYRDGGGGEWDDAFTGVAFRRLIADHLGADDALADRLCRAYLDAWPRHVRLFPDALDTVRAIRSRVPVALVSNGRSEQQRLKIELCGLGELFNAVVISGELGVRKPDAAIFQHALQELGAEAPDAVHVGDSPMQDVAGARSAGLGAVLVSRTARDVARAGAPDAEVPALAAVPALLGVG
jgi:putative hydrolase of the HAD superfamily